LRGYPMIGPEMISLEAAYQQPTRVCHAAANVRKTISASGV
jgi:hypothetical protein